MNNPVKQPLRTLPAVPPEIDNLIKAMPKVELQIHLEGSVHPTTLLKMAMKNGIDIGCKTK